VSGWTPISPWKVIDGSGQTVSLTSGTAASPTNKVGSQTYAIAVRFAPAATAYIGFVRISAAGTAAAAQTDYPISSSDPPQILGCKAGEKVSFYQASGSTESVYMCELTH
jgi:hypothetical protein